MTKYVVEFINKSTGKYTITIHDTKQEADNRVSKLLFMSRKYRYLNCSIYAVDNSAMDKIHKLLKESGESQYEVSLF